MNFCTKLQTALLILHLTKLSDCSKEQEKRKFYYIENEKFLTWSESFDFCKNQSMNLFSVRNDDEYEFLKTILKQKYGRILPYWLGAYRVDGVFKWLPSGDNIMRFIWHRGEPNDKSGHENCIHTWEDYFDWNDNDCELMLPFICEGEDEI